MDKEFDHDLAGLAAQHGYKSQQVWIKNIPLEVREYKGFVRDRSWRPLKLEECSSTVPTTRQGYFDAAAEESPQYYWLE